MPIMNLAQPGSQYGPCQTDCKHPRCVRYCRAAGTICRLCSEEIGYGVDYTQDPKNRVVGARASALVHVACIAIAA